MARIRSFWPRGVEIPWIGGGEPLVSARDVRRVQAERARTVRRAGARTQAQRAEDAEIRALGVPVYDRASGQSELGGYTTRG